MKLDFESLTYFCAEFVEPTKELSPEVEFPKKKLRSDFYTITGFPNNKIFEEVLLQKQYKL